MSQNALSEGPDFSAGIAVESIEDGAILRGHVKGEAALAIRKGAEWRIVGATCSHYGLPLAEGLVVDEEIRCPFHHARFCLRSGKVLGAPALDPIASWFVDIQNGIVRAAHKMPAESPIAPPASLREPAANAPGSTASQLPATASDPVDATRLDARVVIIGGGAAGNAAAEMLRARGHRGSITMLSADEDRPYDRPKCSKALLAGQAERDSVMLRGPDFYSQCRITLHTQTNVTHIDPIKKTVTTQERGTFSYDALLIATGAEPRRLDAPGADLGHVHYLRTLRDTQSLIDACAQGGDAQTQDAKKNVVVIGASFIGLETAASLRARGLEVSVVSPAPLPMEKLLGKPLSDKLRAVHEQHGVTFHVGSTVRSIDSHHVHLVDGSSLPADLVVVGIGVTPRIDLAQSAGIEVREGIVVNALLQTNFPDIYAAGDVAEWPEPFDGKPVRVEHWVVAERQGQAIAQTLLGNAKPFRQSPFFWSIQYDFGIGYIGHVREWDHTESDGDLEKKDWSMTYFSHGEPRAMAIVSRNHQGLKMETMLETQMQKLAEKS